MKKCSHCKQLKPATREFFVSCRRTENGITSPCRECHKARMKVLNKHTYAANREAALIRQYAARDAAADRVCDLTVAFVQVLLAQPCYYCGTVDDPRGCDRLDNRIGHVQANVVACCRLCNKSRNNLFSPEEMKLLGAVIAAIRKSRASS